MEAFSFLLAFAEELTPVLLAGCFLHCTPSSTLSGVTSDSESPEYPKSTWPSSDDAPDEDGDDGGLDTDTADVAGLSGVQED